MVTYNHEKFIAKAIEGVLIQKTNFSLELIICDDNSTDNTELIIKNIINKYRGNIKIRYYRNRKNKGAIKNFNSGLKKCVGTFIATCEGDDYWTDNFKLQKQIDFLNENKDYSICWTNYLILENGNLNHPNWIDSYIDQAVIPVDFQNFSRPYNTYTVTSVFKTSSIDIQVINRVNYFKDNVLYAMCLSNGKGAVLNFKSSIYRIHSDGVYSLATDYIKALSNYICYEEILLLFESSRVENIITKRNNWKKQFLKELYKRDIPKYKKWLIRLRYVLYFKYLKVKTQFI